MLDSPPPEILLHILSFLDVRNLICAACVCKLWHSIADDHTLWKAIIEQTKLDQDEDLEEFITLLHQENPLKELAKELTLHNDVNARILYNQLMVNKLTDFPDRIILIALGAPKSGVSSFALRLTTNMYLSVPTTSLAHSATFWKYPMTVAVRLMGGYVRVHVDVYDAEKFSAGDSGAQLLESLIGRAHGILCMVDVTAKQPGEKVCKLVACVNKTAKSPLPMMLVGTKLDSVVKGTAARALSAHLGEQLANELGFSHGYMEVSSKFNYHVRRAALTLIKHVVHGKGGVTV